MTIIQLDPRLRANLIAAIREVNTTLGFTQSLEDVTIPEVSDFFLIYYLGMLHSQLHSLGISSKTIARSYAKFLLPFDKGNEVEFYPTE